MQAQDLSSFQVKTARHALPPKVLILTVSHGTSHTRVAYALQAGFSSIAPNGRCAVVDGLCLCAPWFRAYYDSYLILLKIWPRLWGWIEGIQHKSKATSPGWLHRCGAQPLFRFLRKRRPEIVIATEVGMCELAVMMKRHYRMSFLLVASCGMDVDRAWVQPEVDVFIVPPGDAKDQILAAGAPASKVHATGVPVDPAFATLPNCQSARRKLGLLEYMPVLLVLFGGAGFGDPDKILPQLQKIRRSVQKVFIAGRNERLVGELERRCRDDPYSTVRGPVNNIHEWMAAADLLLSQPGASTVDEAINAGLPLVAFAPLPGSERRLCYCIEKWQVGRWARKTKDISAILNHLFSSPQDRRPFRKNAQAMALPRAAYDGAEAILKCWRSQEDTNDAPTSD